MISLAKFQPLAVDGQTGGVWQKILLDMGMLAPEKRKLGDNLIQAFEIPKGLAGMDTDDRLVQFTGQKTSTNRVDIWKAECRVVVDIFSWNRLSEELFWIRKMKFFRILLHIRYDKVFPRVEYWG